MLTARGTSSDGGPVVRMRQVKRRPQGPTVAKDGGTRRRQDGGGRVRGRKTGRNRQRTTQVQRGNRYASASHERFKDLFLVFYVAN